MWYIINAIQAIVGIAWVILAAYIMIPLLPYKYTYWYACKVFSPLFILMMGGRLKVYGREHIKKGESYIYMANHSSFSDIPILYASTQQSLHFIAKTELKKSLFGVPIRKMRMIFVDRANLRNSIVSIRRVADMINKGKNVAIFPEGTRSRTGKLGNFKRGSFKIAVHAGVKIIPVGIQGAATIVGHNNLKYRPSKVVVKIGKPISTDGYNDDNVGELAEIVKSEIQKLITN